MSEVSPPPPEGAPVVDAERRLITRDWIDWYRTLEDRIDNSVRKINVITLDDQAASIGSTSLPAASVDAGLYRVSYYIRVTQPATVSSGIQITLSWQDKGHNCSLVSANLTTNTLDTLLIDTKLLAVDRAAALTFATTYATSGATPMKYKVRIVLELCS